MAAQVLNGGDHFDIGPDGNPKAPGKLLPSARAGAKDVALRCRNLCAQRMEVAEGKAITRNEALGMLITRRADTQVVSEGPEEATPSAHACSIQ